MIQWCRRLLQECKRNAIVSGASYAVRQSNKGTVLDFQAGSISQSSPVQIKELALVKVFGDYVVGNDTSVTPPVSYQVARPYKQRNSLTGETALDGTLWIFSYPQNARLTTLPNPVTYKPTAFVSRSKIVGGVTVFQRTTPEFLVGDVFYAVNMNNPITNGAGTKVVSVGAAFGDSINAAGTPITWQYEDGRQWADTPDGLA